MPVHIFIQQIPERPRPTRVTGLRAERAQPHKVAGLDLDFRGEPFGPVPTLLARAEHVEKLTAICRCGAAATRTQRLIGGHPAHYDDPVILVGAQESYEPRCRRCHAVPRAARAAPLFGTAVG